MLCYRETIKCLGLNILYPKDLRAKCEQHSALTLETPSMFPYRLIIAQLFIQSFSHKRVVGIQTITYMHSCTTDQSESRIIVYFAFTGEL